MLRYELLVFDWDGTLYDSSCFIVKCVQKAAEQVDLPIPDKELIKQSIGLSVSKAIERSMPDISPMQQANLVQAYRRVLVEHACKPTLFEGAKEVLQGLRHTGYLLAIATGKDSRGLALDLELLGIEDLFIATRGADQAASKPDPLMLTQLLDETGSEPEQALVIGDTEFDLLMAENANVDALAVSYGVHDTERLQGERVRGLIHDIRELPEWLAGGGKQDA